MVSNLKWISRVTLLGMSVVAFASTASAQRTHVVGLQRSLVPAADEARNIFNAGQQFYDQSRYVQAETRFREVVQRFPKNVIADRADYYLIRTLSQSGKKAEAITRIDGFANRYPKSTWISDVQELRIQLTNRVPPRAEALLFGQAPPAPPA